MGVNSPATLQPTQEEELTAILSQASRDRHKVALWGGGTHRDIGHQPPSDLILSTAGMSGVIDWEPDDLTVVVKAGTPVADLEAQLATGAQSAMLPEVPGAATVGGVVATATSAYRRLRYGPTRDRVLEVRAVTGDGRVVKGGGRVVKNVSGYDLPRLYTGSLGSLGVITSVCLKLWPLPAASATVRLAELPAPDSVHRPLAVLETGEGVSVLVAGTEPEVAAAVNRLAGAAVDRLEYPDLPSGEVVWSLRIRPKLLPGALDQLPDGSDFVAQHGVGEVSFGAARDHDVTALRAWSEAEGGAVVRVRGDSEADPWGTPPSGLELQRRVVAAFDPHRVLEPGRLPGGI